MNPDAAKLDAASKDAAAPDGGMPAVAMPDVGVPRGGIPGEVPPEHAPDVARELGLQPHPEGGWYKETWRSDLSFAPEGYDGPRRCASAIYYLLNPGERSRWHLVCSDEIWLWHNGGPLTLRLGGIGETPDEMGSVHFTVGGDIMAGQHPQVVVPGGVWQSAEPAGGEPVLVTCMVAPGFDFADFRMA
jgi:predicted cupin superfamily sugar epimerase